ncbi:hypothetical protein WA026_014317 [Henosepilachna vigintioctopunctata]|uniref:ABC transmembrane type-1 domain-containing protein n=1 Tax=Henosepilachna vigintioctopunctata TaxID=420089 RepID=A0AAW1UMG0_9CUCU
MDSSKHHHNISPENSANFVSKLLFWWTIPFFKYGYKNDLKMKDVYNVMSSDRSEYLANELEKNWTSVKAYSLSNKVKPSLLIAIRNTFWKSFMVVGIIIMLRNVLYAYFMPIVLSQFIEIFNESPRDIIKGSYLGATVIIMNFLNCLIAHQGTLYTRRIGMRVRIACCSLMYRKVLKLNTNSLNTTGAGMLVNLLSNDVNRLDFAASVIHFIWIMPIQAAIGTYVMYSFVGPVAFVAIGAMILQAVPVQGYLSRIQGQLRRKIASKTDHRMKVTNEVLSQIQMIKMYVWEKQFQKVVTCLRKSEINLIKKPHISKQYQHQCKYSQKEFLST